MDTKTITLQVTTFTQTPDRTPVSLLAALKDGQRVIGELTKIPHLAACAQLALRFNNDGCRVSEWNHVQDTPEAEISQAVVYVNTPAH